MLSLSAFKRKLKISEAGNETKYWSLCRSKTLVLTARVGGSLSPDDVADKHKFYQKQKSLLISTDRHLIAVQFITSMSHIYLQL